MFQTDISVGDTTVTSEISGCLLSCKTSEALGLIEIKLPAVVNSIRPRMVSGILVENNPQMFKGVGKISGHQQKLFFDDTVPGSALPYRYPPFHLHKELKKKFNDRSTKTSSKKPKVLHLGLVP